ncbi:hypothetical protein JCM18899A_08360 [Nocardioides sp. AN3]
MRVEAPPRAVFDYLSDPRRRPEWQSSLRSVDMLDDGPLGIGTRWVDRTAVGASPRMEITAMRLSPDGTGVWAEVGAWRGVRAVLSLRFAPEPAEHQSPPEAPQPPTRTRLTGSVEVSSTPVWLPVGLTLRALAPVAIASDLRRAARLIEDRTRPGATG